MKTGDYVLATKYADGDAGDHFCVGFYGGSFDHYGQTRHIVVDADGQAFRANGFRRVARIGIRRGEWIVQNLALIAALKDRFSVWHWHRAPWRELRSMQSPFFLDISTGLWHHLPHDLHRSHYRPRPQCLDYGCSARASTSPGHASLAVGRVMLNFWLVVIITTGSVHVRQEVELYRTRDRCENALVQHAITLKPPPIGSGSTLRLECEGFKVPWRHFLKPERVA